MRIPIGVKNFGPKSWKEKHTCGCFSHFVSRNLCGLSLFIIYRSFGQIQTLSNTNFPLHCYLRILFAKMITFRCLLIVFSCSRHNNDNGQKTTRFVQPMLIFNVHAHCQINRFSSVSLHSVFRYFRGQFKLNVKQINDIFNSHISIQSVQFQKMNVANWILCTLAFKHFGNITTDFLFNQSKVNMKQTVWPLVF